MQARAADDLKKIVTDRLVAAGLVYEGAKAFATPRRLALSVHGVPARQPDMQGRKEGPARRRARAARSPASSRRPGLQSIEQAKVQPDKKGDFYVALIEKPGRPALEVMAEMMPEVVRALPVAEVDALGQRAGSPGCGRCIRSSPPSGRRPKSRTSCRSTSTASRPATRRAATASWRRRVQGAPLRRLRRQARSRQGGARSGAPRRHDPRRRQEPRLRARLRAGGGRGPAGRGRRPGGMAGDADGLVRRGVPGDPRRGDPRHHPQQPEMLRAARSADRQAGQQVHSGRQRGSQRRRQGDRRRQRARDPRAALRRQVLLRHRPEDAAGRPAAEIRAHRVPREARHAGRAHRAHRGARRASWRRSSAPTAPRPSAPRNCARPIC